MHPFTEQQFKKLLSNGRNYDQDHAPVALLFLTNTRCVWLINEVNPNMLDEAFGLCDLGMGQPELGYVSLEEMMHTQCENDFIFLYNDPSFSGVYPMSVYQQLAKEYGRIINNAQLLKATAQKLNL